MRRSALLLALLAAPCSLATSWVTPGPRLYTNFSASVTYGFKLLPNPSDPLNGPATGELFRLTHSGATPVLWRKTLPTLPLTVLVAPTGHVVTLDTYAGDRKTKHALVILAPNGKVVLDATFSEVAPGREHDPRFFIGVSGPYLSEGFTAKFVYWDKPYFTLRDAHGHGPTFDLDTGRRRR